MKKGHICNILHSLNRGIHRGDSQECSFSPHPSRPTLGPTQPSVQCVPGFFREGKAAGVWSWPLTCNWSRGWECVALYLHSSCTPSSRGQGLCLGKFVTTNNNNNNNNNNNTAEVRRITKTAQKTWTQIHQTVTHEQNMQITDERITAAS